MIILSACSISYNIAGRTIWSGSSCRGLVTILDQRIKVAVQAAESLRRSVIAAAIGTLLVIPIPIPIPIPISIPIPIAVAITMTIARAKAMTVTVTVFAGVVAVSPTSLLPLLLPLPRPEHLPIDIG